MWIADAVGGRAIRVREGENSGWGDMESIIIGEYPGVTLVD